MKITRVFFILDESGSMSDCIQATVSGYNEFLSSLKEDKGDIVLVSLLKFDSRRVEKVYLHKNIAEVRPMSPDDFSPGQLTPLYDALGEAITLAKEKASPEDSVILVVLTDGQENSSKEYSLAMIKGLLKEAKEVRKWKVVFLGADIDAYATYSHLGVSVGDTLSYSKVKHQAGLMKMSSAVNNLRSTYMSAGLQGVALAQTFSKEDQEELKNNV